jgi:hypothetical protein
MLYSVRNLSCPVDDELTPTVRWDVLWGTLTDQSCHAFATAHGFLFGLLV